MNYLIFKYMAFIQSDNLAEAIWEDEAFNIEKRFNANLEDLEQAISRASDRQHGAIYHAWQGSHPFKMYPILKTLGLKERISEEQVKEITEKIQGKTCSEQTEIFKTYGITTFREARYNGIMPYQGCTD